MGAKPFRISDKIDNIGILSCEVNVVWEGHQNLTKKPPNLGII